MSFDIERELIASLTSAEALDTYFKNDVNGSLFADSRYGDIFDWAKSYYANYGGMETPPSAEVIADNFEDYPEIVSDAKGGATPAYLVSELRTMVAKRGIQQAVREVSNTITDDAISSALILQERLSGIISQATQVRSQIVYGEDLEGQRRAAMQLVAAESTDGVPYPIKEMNEHSGGMRLGEITILMAPPSQGKSWFACACALSAKNSGHNAYFASLEMDTAVMAQRIELLWANRATAAVPPLDYSSGLVLPEYSVAMEQAMKEIADMPGKLVIDAPQNRTVAGLFASARMHGCNFIIIDQLQFISRPKGDSRTEQIEQIINAIAAEARNHPSGEKMAVLLLSQMNREGVKGQASGKIGNMTNLAMSASLEQVADTVWGLGRSDEMKATQLMNIATMKARRFPEVGWQLNWQTKSRAFMGVSYTNGTPDILREW